MCVCVICNNHDSNWLRMLLCLLQLERRQGSHIQSTSTQVLCYIQQHCMTSQFADGNPTHDFPANNISTMYSPLQSAGCTRTSQAGTAEAPHLRKRTSTKNHQPAASTSTVPTLTYITKYMALRAWEARGRQLDHAETAENGATCCQKLAQCKPTVWPPRHE